MATGSWCPFQALLASVSTMKTHKTPHIKRNKHRISSHAILIERENEKTKIKRHNLITFEGIHSRHISGFPDHDAHFEDLLRRKGHIVWREGEGHFWLHDIHPQLEGAWQSAIMGCSRSKYNERDKKQKNNIAIFFLSFWKRRGGRADQVLQKLEIHSPVTVLPY